MNLYDFVEWSHSQPWMALATRYYQTYDPATDEEFFVAEYCTKDNILDSSVSFKWEDGRFQHKKTTTPKDAVAAIRWDRSK